MKVKLKYPITIKATDDQPETELSVLTFGRIKAKHLKLIPDSCFVEEGAGLKPMEVIPLLAGLAGISNEVADELDMVDLLTITGEVLPTFLSDYQPANKKEQN